MKILQLLGLAIMLIPSLVSAQSEIEIKKNNNGITSLNFKNNANSVFIGENSGVNAYDQSLGNTGIGRNALYLVDSGDYNTGVGQSALSSVKVGHSNTGIGRFSLLNTNDAIWNTGLGASSMLNNITGDGNLALGYESLYSGMTSNYNIGLGFRSGYLNNGSYNMFMGYRAGYNNLGSYNVFIGHSAGENILGNNKLVIENSDVDSTQALIYGEFDNNILRFNADVNINGAYTLPSTPGKESQILTLNGNNEAVWDSLTIMDQDSTNELIQAAVGGYNNIWIAEGTTGHIIDLHVGQLKDGDSDTGIFADKNDIDEDIIRIDIDGTENVVMQKNANGAFRMEIVDPNDNTAVGYAALYSNNTGIGNTAYSRNALRFNQSGNGNVALGRAAMQFSVTGDYNTYVGDLAGFRNNGGNKNVGLGSLALAENVTGEGNVGLGHYAGYFETGSNKLYIANDSVRADEALVYGEFDNQLLRVNGELNVNGDYSLPTDTATVNQFMVMGPDGKMRWHSEQVKYTGVNVQWGWINSFKEIYDGQDTTTFELQNLIITPMIEDEDGDTKVEVQNIGGADEDMVRFNIDGTEKIVLKNNADGDVMMEFQNNKDNVFIGENAGLNTIYSDNTFIGHESGKNNSAGWDNTFLGFGSGMLNITGDWNTYIGSNAGRSIINGSRNTFVGEVSGENAIGNRNTHLGIGSGRHLVGDKNVVIGNNAGLDAEGDSNVLIGSEAGYNSQGGNNLFIENTSADSTGALIYGEFDTDQLRFNADVNINGNYTLPTEAPERINQFLIVGPGNELTWHQPGFEISDAYMEYGYFIQEKSQLFGLFETFESTAYEIETPMIVDEDGDTKIEVQELSGPDVDVISFDVDGVEKMRLNSTNVRVNSDLGIGTDAAYPIHINDSFARIKLANNSNVGVASYATQNFWTHRLSNDSNNETLGVDMTELTFEPYQNDTLTLGTASYKWKEIFATNATINTSDRRFKKNINDMSYGLSEVMQMRPVTYQWKKEKEGRTITGFIAQEMEEIIPEVVHKSDVIANPNKPDAPVSELEELYGMRYTELIPVLTKAIQDQQEIINALTERVEALEAKE